MTDPQTATTQLCSSCLAVAHETLGLQSCAAGIADVFVYDFRTLRSDSSCTAAARLALCSAHLPRVPRGQHHYLAALGRDDLRTERRQTSHDARGHHVPQLRMHLTQHQGIAEHRSGLGSAPAPEGMSLT